MSSLSYDDLFALRIELSDEFQDENRKLKRRIASLEKKLKG